MAVKTSKIVSAYDRAELVPSDKPTSTATTNQVGGRHRLPAQAYICAATVKAPVRFVPLGSPVSDRKRVSHECRWDEGEVVF
jgi:hypothetical protein